jgi:SAM-dependent methyltransferase
MSDVSPLEFRAIWQRKPVLQTVYQRYFQRLLEACIPGSVLEIGGGAGSMKDHSPAIVSTDIQFAPWLDVTSDAQALPFADGGFDNMVMLDVLHHLPDLRRFFAEAVRVVRRGGRIVMIEPAMTPIARIFYSHFHPEPVDMNVDPLSADTGAARRLPLEGNQAIPHLLFKRQAGRLEKEFPNLAVRDVRFLSLFAYPLSGGFRPWSLLPNALASAALAVDDVLGRLLGPVMGFRLFVVIERI